MEKAAVDRIESKLAVLLVGDDERRLNVPLSSLPKRVKEGDWLRIELRGHEVVQAEIDIEETQRRKQRVEGLLEKLRRKGNSK